MRISIEMKGLQKTITRLNRFEKNKENDIKRVINEYGHIIEGQAVALAPVDEGNLKNSMTLDFKDKGLTAEISNSTEYAPYVEFGTGIFAEGGNGRETPWVYYSEKLHRFVMTQGMKAQPFLHPAFDMNRRRFVNSMRKALKEPER